MPRYFKLTDGGSMGVTGDLGPHCADHRCSWWSGFLCDYPVGPEETCDRPLCSDHAYEIGPEVHYCLPHYEMWREFVDGGGVQEYLENVLPYKPKPEDQT